MYIVEVYEMSNVQVNALGKKETKKQSLLFNTMNCVDIN